MMAPRGVSCGRQRAIDITGLVAMLRSRLKRFIKSILGTLGYAVRGVGNGVGGVELLHDARILLGDALGTVLFDVGANVGQTTRAMLDTFPSPRVFAFEPSPATFDSLRRALGGRPGVKVEALAMGSTEGKLPFHVTREHSVNDSLLVPAWQAGGSVVEVRVETVDGYCERAGLESIGLLKIDAQGYDAEVLRGARHMLDGRRIHLYSCEANFERLYEGQATLRDLLAFADEVGYQLVGFYEQTYLKDRLSYLDALFCAG
jgi:FkbM family methyltransferase